MLPLALFMPFCCNSAFFNGFLNSLTFPDNEGAILLPVPPHYWFRLHARSLISAFADAIAVALTIAVAADIETVSAVSAVSAAAAAAAPISAGNFAFAKK